MKLKTFLLMAVIGIWLCGCASDQIAGTGTETSTKGSAKIRGVIINNQGNVASNVAVQLLVAQYDPISSEDAIAKNTTDSLGQFVFSGLDSGTFNLQASEASDGTKLLIQKITVLPRDSVSVPVDTLKKTGTIVIDLSDSLILTAGYVYIPGTTIAKQLDSLMIALGQIVLDSVPSSTFAGIQYKANAGSGPRMITDSLKVVPGAVTSIGAFTSWQYAKKLILNTTVSGADVASTVTNFPVLVRLLRADFPFDQAKVDGSDIRFTKADGTPLPHEIEQWDSANGTATIWVLIDTLYGNDSTACRMLWGNPNAFNLSNAGRVFDTLNGFAGVWHMQGANDATVNQNNGTSYGTATVAGLIGSCTDYRNSAYMKIDTPATSSLNFDNRSFSFALWVYVDSSLGVYDSPFWKGGSSLYYERGYDLELGSGTWEFSVQDSPVSKDVVVGNETEFLKSWTYLAAVIDQESNLLKVYANGVLRDSVDISAIQTLSNDNPLYIGRSDVFFNGKIDEVRVCSKALTNDWIRLSYYNQSSNDRLIMWPN